MRQRTTSGFARLACERGQAALEFALILPVLLLLVLGGIFVANAITRANDSTQLAGDGVRFAAVGKPALKQFLLDRAQAQSKGFRDSITSITITCLDGPVPAGQSQVGHPIEVAVTVHVGKLPFGLHDAFNVTRKATMRIEQQPPDADYENC